MVLDFGDQLWHEQWKREKTMKKICIKKHKKKSDFQESCLNSDQKKYFTENISIFVSGTSAF